MAGNRINVPIIDGNGKRSVATFPCTTPTDGQITALYDALAGIVLGVRGGASIVTEAAKDAADAGTAPGTALRSVKWLCRYQDTVDSSIHTLEIGTADTSLQALPSKNIDLTAGAGLAFKTAFDAAVKSPQNSVGQGGGNAVTLLSVEAVTRSL